MSIKMDYRDLSNYNKIIIYGAGAVGRIFLKRLAMFFDERHKIIVWDERYSELKELFGFNISKPDFSRFCKRHDVIAIIALHDKKNRILIKEIEQRFIHSGYGHIIHADEIGELPTKIRVDAFCDEAYADCSYQDDVDFSDMFSPVKPIAFYLPQFHDIPENDEWWGKGFTEWTNTTSAAPNFTGHYQPREPHSDFGYYDLSDVNTIRKQAELAKRHGIYGWCIYYYWFSGKKLLTKPLDILLEHKDIDIDFCLLWCNDNWTKIWVGDYDDILIKNDYSSEDPDKFIDDLSKFINDERYIRINGKPLVLVYLVYAIPDVRNVVRRWRERAKEIGIGEIAVFSMVRPHTIDVLGLQGCFDAEAEFCPLQYSVNSIQLENIHGSAVSGKLYYYEECQKNYIRVTDKSDHSAYMSCMCGWDNTPRYKQKSKIYNLGFSMRLFYDMVRYATEEAIANGKDYFFVFAWNEWAESAYLEPDKKFGYAMINTFSRALFALPFEP